MIYIVTNLFGDESVLKSTTGWKVDSSCVDDEEWDGNGNGTDGLGFSIFPDGTIEEDGWPRHHDVGSSADFWMASYYPEDDDLVVFGVRSVNFWNDNSGYANSVRCVKD